MLEKYDFAYAGQIATKSKMMTLKFKKRVVVF